MNKVLQYFSAAGSAALTFGAKMLGGWDLALKVLFVVMALDFVTGLICAFCGKSDKTETHSFRSSAAFKGITKKLMMTVIVMLGTACDQMLGCEVCRLAVIAFYVAEEGLSILENAAALGVPVPQILRNQMETLKQKGEKDE